MPFKYLPGILAMAAIVVASNILVQFRFGPWLTWGAFTYPLAFLITDIVNRVHGAAFSSDFPLAWPARWRGRRSWGAPGRW